MDEWMDEWMTPLQSNSFQATLVEEIIVEVWVDVLHAHSVSTSAPIPGELPPTCRPLSAKLQALLSPGSRRLKTNFGGCG